MTGSALDLEGELFAGVRDAVIVVENHGVLAAHVANIRRQRRATGYRCSITVDKIKLIDIAFLVPVLVGLRFVFKR